MQLKSARGVQQDEVWGAADALVAEGLRPTIERVRQKIGRGSPNTVSPMLESWFATLGSRLGVGPNKKSSAADEIPAPVRLAAQKLWDVALLSAQGVAEQGLLQAKQALDADHAAVELRSADLANREQLLQLRQDALDEALQVARNQIADLTSRLEQSQAALLRRDVEIDALQLRLLDSEKQRNADQRRSEEDAGRHADERRRLEEHASITERRLMTELDRERQETKRLKSKLDDAEQSAEAVGKRFQEDTRMLTQRLRDVEIELHSEHQSLLLANARGVELRGLLDDQRVANSAALAQMSLFLKEVTHNASTSKPRRRVKSSAGDQTKKSARV